MMLKDPIPVKVIEGVYGKVKSVISKFGHDRCMVVMEDGQTKHLHLGMGGWYACIHTYANQREVQRVEF